MQKDGNSLVFNVLLLGPRRTGKSSILASMIGNFKEAASSTFIDVTGDETTKTLNEQSLIKLQNIYNKYNNQKVSKFTMDENQSFDSNNFQYTIAYRDKKNRTKPLAKTVFKDRPGEWIDDPEHQEEMKQEVGEADVLLIAIDSVHLMEMKGAFCEVYHRIAVLHHFIADSHFLDENSGKKLVLLIPLKCERYYHDKYMNEVNAAVHKHFSPILDLLTGERVKNRVTVGITPILTIGGIEFDSFGTDENGKIIRIRDRTLGSQLQRRPNPQYIYFRFYKDKPEFQPQYCEQPVLYLLYYIVSLTKDISKQQSVVPTIVGLPFGLLGIAIVALLNALWKSFNDKNVKFSLETLKPKIKRTGQGYEIIQNPLNI